MGDWLSDGVVGFVGWVFVIWWWAGLCLHTSGFLAAVILFAC